MWHYNKKHMTVINPPPPPPHTHTQGNTEYLQDAGEWPEQPPLAGGWREGSEPESGENDPEIVQLGRQLNVTGSHMPPYES